MFISTSQMMLSELILFSPALCHLVDQLGNNCFDTYRRKRINLSGFDRFTDIIIPVLSEGYGNVYISYRCFFPSLRNLSSSCFI